MKYSATLHPVSDRGTPPVGFLDELVAVARRAPDSLFAPNSDPEDVYPRLVSALGPWRGILHRKAAMCELIRCLGGFESAWHWGEGVDTTNHQSEERIECQETGMFQVSFNSLNLDVHGPDTVADLHACVRRYCGEIEVHTFIMRMKTDHEFAIMFVFTLLRNSFLWDGPIKRGEVTPWLRKDAVEEFVSLLSA